MSDENQENDGAEFLAYLLNDRPETKEEKELGWLRETLSKDYWDFSEGVDHFDGISEGICYFIGITPRLSGVIYGKHRMEYRPSYLPGGYKHNWGASVPSSWDESNLRDLIHQSADRFRPLRLSGLQNVQGAIRKACKYGFKLPWWNVANDDLACAKRLPAELRENLAIAKRIKSEQTRSAANRRVAKSGKSNFIDFVCRKRFDEVFANPPATVLVKSTGKLKALSIAKWIWNLEIGIEEHGPLPDPTAIAKHVRIWIEEKSGSAVLSLNSR